MEPNNGTPSVGLRGRRWMNVGFVLLVLLGFGNAVHGDEWRGFRGLEREGNSESAKHVAEWGPEQNVRWKTEIPGEGHSSPVVSQDSVYLTTAFLSETGTAAKAFARYAVYALALSVGVLALVSFIRSCRTQPTLRFWSLVLFCFVMGVTFSKLVAAHVYTDENDVEASLVRWILTGHVSTLFILLAGIQFAGKPWVRLLLGVIAIAFSALMLFGRPEPLYHTVFDEDGITYYGMRVLTSLVIPAIAGCMLILVAAWRLIWRRSADGAATQGPSTGSLALRIVLLVSALCAGALIPIHAVRLVLYIGTGEDIGALLALTGTKELFFGMCLFLAAGALALLPISREGSGRLATWLGIGFVCAAVGVFVERNYILTGNEFVRAIVCVDRATGDIKWTTKALGGLQKRTYRYNSQASPTAVFDDERVYAYFGSAGLMCTDHSGRLLWTNDRLPFEGIHGVAGSPTLSDGIVLIANDGGPVCYVVGIDAKTGQQIWKQDMDSGSQGAAGNYRTPQLKSFGGRTEVLVWGWNDLRSFDLHTGEPLWKINVMNAELHKPVASIVADGDHLYLATKSAVRGFSLPLCHQGEDAMIWESRGGGPRIASPVRVGDLLFVVSDRGIATCLDTKSGKKVWRERLPSGQYFASLVAVGDHVYAFTDTGITTVFAAERNFRQISENDIKEYIFATPAPVDGQLFIRTTTNLWCVEEL